ncbi:hypothetical protein [Kordiimonas sp. SCSIO 12610]|uniref:hypothetical protein n=1 Tax=Kordiimonas sp. SCSIO 12610 TaxID=2829597 RepID=UPI00210B8B90|nr:hypothetical protein [Kordiimonas sp. SCSIO 12610]UTW54286.1 hypothetical protein KFF44_10700 [Kordiimonas sp. SCSIO 12610]
MSEYTNVLKQFPLEPRPDIPIFASFLDIYYSKMSGGSIPRWSDFKIHDFAGWHPNMALSDKIEDGDDYIFRIFGTGFVDLFAQDFTGAPLCQSMAPGHVASSKQHFHKLEMGPYIGWAKGVVPLEGREYLPFEVIDLPLQNELGKVTSFIHLLGVKSKVI